MTPTTMPSMAALRAFVKAIEHRSFTRAAESLGVTHGAVIHQIRALETAMGTRLLARGSRNVQTTDAGAVLYRRVAKQIYDLEKAFLSTRQSSGRARIVLSVMSSFAQGWVVPNLLQLQSLLRGAGVEIRLEFTLQDDLPGDVDVAIRWGEGPWPGLASTILCREVLFPVVSPSYAQLPKLSRPEDLLQADLIENAYAPWTNWLDEAGIPHASLRVRATIADSYTCQLAAETGSGVALGRHTLARAALDAGRLVRPFGLSVRTKENLWAIWRPADESLERILRLVTFMQESLSGAA